LSAVGHFYPSAGIAIGESRRSLSGKLPGMQIEKA
jgi:hypothetical protein